MRSVGIFFLVVLLAINIKANDLLNIATNEVFNNKYFYFKSFALKGTLKGYSDPVVYSIYAGLIYNVSRNFDFAKIDYGNTVLFGGDLNIVLSPKITLDMGIEQRFQSANKINNKKTTNIRSIPTYSVGSTIV